MPEGGATPGRTALSLPCWDSPPPLLTPQLLPPTPPVAFSEHLLYPKARDPDKILKQSPPWWGPIVGLQKGCVHGL